MSSIYKSAFKDLDFLILDSGIISKIPKIIIFVNKIDNAIWIVKYI